MFAPSKPVGLALELEVPVMVCCPSSKLLNDFFKTLTNVPCTAALLSGLQWLARNRIQISQLGPINGFACVLLDGSRLNLERRRYSLLRLQVSLAVLVHTQASTMTQLNLDINECTLYKCQDKINAQVTTCSESSTNPLIAKNLRQCLYLSHLEIFRS